MRTEALVKTENGAKYMTQLCKHWSHKLQVDLTETRGVVRFPTAVATMEAGAASLAVAIEADDAETVERM